MNVPTREEIQPLLDDRLVKAERHPALPITIYNYTALCQYDRKWCPVSRACRGLILADDGLVVARPFPKFHNYDEHSRSEIAFSKPFSVAEKMDGSLGIIYPAENGYAVATRGSFVSEQAKRATEMLRSDYPAFQPLSDRTYLVEIVYPENRVVVNYGSRQELVLLAAIDHATGRDVEAAGWMGPRAKAFEVNCRPKDVLTELALVDDGNAEGVVLRFDWPKTGPNFRVKVKLDEYKRLHRLIFGVSTKTVWEALSQGQPLEDIMERVPDEFHAWLQATIDDLKERHVAIDQQARREFRLIQERLRPEASRREFAAEAVKSEHRALLFKLLDGSDYTDLIWKDLRPAYAKPFRYQGEDVA